VALEALDQLDTLKPAAGDHQPYFAARAHWLAAGGRSGEARAAYIRAAALSADPALRAFLQGRAAQL